MIARADVFITNYPFPVRARLRLRGAWMVGDSPEADIGGAAGLGMPSIWIRRGREWTERRFAPTRAVNGVIQAVAAVMSLAHSR